MAGFTLSFNDGYLESSTRHKDQFHQHHHKQLHKVSHHYSPIQPTILNASCQFGIIPKDVVNVSPTRDDLIHGRCTATENEIEDNDNDDDDNDRQSDMLRSRSWLCCPGERDTERVVAIHVNSSDDDVSNSIQN